MIAIDQVDEVDRSGYKVPKEIEQVSKGREAPPNAEAIDDASLIESIYGLRTNLSKLWGRLDLFGPSGEY